MNGKKMFIGVVMSKEAEKDYAIDRERMRPLQEALSKENIDLQEVKSLFEQHHYTPDELNHYQMGYSSESMPLLHCMAARGEKEAAELLNQHGASVNTLIYSEKLHREVTPLSLALFWGYSETGYSKMCRFLLDQKAIDVTKGSLIDMVINEKCSINILADLKKRGAPVNSIDQEGNSPLHHAVRLMRVDMVQWLVNNGVSLEQKTTKPVQRMLCAGGDREALTANYTIPVGSTALDVARYDKMAYEDLINGFLEGVEQKSPPHLQRFIDKLTLIEDIITKALKAQKQPSARATYGREISPRPAHLPRAAMPPQVIQRG
jgi:hypothetical protein